MSYILLLPHLLLLHLMGAPTSESKPSTTALVNLTASPDVATRAVEKGAVERAMEFLRAGAESDGSFGDDKLMDSEESVEEA